MSRSSISTRMATQIIPWTGQGPIRRALSYCLLSWLLQCKELPNSSQSSTNNSRSHLADLKSRTFTCIGVVPVAERIIFDLEGKEDKPASILLVTVWELGEAAGPLLIAPLSEIYGRYPVFNIANLIFIFGVVLAALSQTSGILIFCRFLTGFAVASNVLNPAIIGDIYPSEQRGSGMSLVMLAPFLGGAIGPAISGAIAEKFGWRKILWMSAVIAITCELLFFTLFRETYKVPILQRRAARLRKEKGDETLKCAFERENARLLWWSTLRTTITRPFVVLVHSSVLQIMSLYGGAVFSFYYILATTLPDILREVYGFSPTMIGLSFLSFSKIVTFHVKGSANVNRYWWNLRSLRMQLIRWSHIRQAWKIQRRESSPWIPNTITDRRSICLPRDRRTLRMDSIQSMVRSSAPCGCRHSRISCDDDHGTLDFLCRGFFRALFRFRNDDGTYSSLFGRNSHTTNYSSPDQRSWNRIWLPDFGCDMCGLDTFACAGDAIWVALAPEFGIYEKLVDARVLFTVI